MLDRRAWLVAGLAAIAMIFPAAALAAPEGAPYPGGTYKGEAQGNDRVKLKAQSFVNTARFLGKGRFRVRCGIGKRQVGLFRTTDGSFHISAEIAGAKCGSTCGDGSPTCTRSAGG